MGDGRCKVHTVTYLLGRDDVRSLGFEGMGIKGIGIDDGSKEYGGGVKMVGFLYLINSWLKWVKYILFFGEGLVILCSICLRSSLGKKLKEMLSIRFYFVLRIGIQ